MKRAVVLGGGGSRGSYQIGVWQGIRELELEYQIVTGTSVGALNGALMVQGDYERAKEIWSRISLKDVLDIDLTDLDLKKKDHRKQLFNIFFKEKAEKWGADLNALSHTMDNYISEEAFFASGVDFALMTVKYPSFKPVPVFKGDIPPGMLKDYLLASAALFPAFQAQKVGKDIYIDGGYYDNMPVNLALDMGAQEVLAVDLRAFGKIQRVKRTKAFIKYIRPYNPLGTLLSFNETLAKRNMRLGYLDTLKALGHLEGIGFSFYLGESKKNPQELGEAFKEGLRLLDDSKKTPLSRLAVARVCKLLGLNKNKGDYLELLPWGAQYAGEIFNLEDTKIYFYQEYNYRLLDSYKEFIKKWEQLMPGPGIFNSGEIKDKLALLDKRAVSAFLVWLINQVDEGKIPAWDLQALAFAFGKETAAALYIRCLLSLEV